jgi:hypothetical protein
VLGNEISKNRPWQGTLRMVAIHNRVLTAEQIQQNFEVGVGQKFFLLFGIGDVDGVPAGSYIMFEVSQYDSYSYLFAKPTFINLDASVVPGSIPIAGMRIAINGKEATVGQAYTNLNMTIGNNYDPATGEVLSSLGTIIALQNGQSGDEFFLTFELLGTESNTFSEVSPTIPQPLPTPAPASDIGVRTFDEINASMAVMTDVDPADVQASFLIMRQSLPSVETMEGFLAAQQMSITQLAIEYCDALVENAGLRNAFFATAVGDPTKFDFDADVASAFAGGEATVIVDDLYDNMIALPGSGTLSDVPSRIEIQEVLVDGYNYVDSGGTSYPVTSLFDIMSPGGDTRTIVKGLCGAVLGSAAMLVQ